MTTPNVSVLLPPTIFGVLLVDMAYSVTAPAAALDSYIINLATACSVRSDGHDDADGCIAALEIIGRYLQGRLTQAETISSLKGLYQECIDDADAGSQEA